ncbi:hypothetical protein JXQ70_07150 [bacterium]|nr:hypothetical protein [bacterium]
MRNDNRGERTCSSMVFKGYINFTSLIYCLYALTCICISPGIVESDPNNRSDQHNIVSEEQNEDRHKDSYFRYTETDGQLLLTLKVKDADVREVLAELADIKKLNLILDQDVKGRISLSFRDVPWLTALEEIVRTSGLAIECDQNVLYAEPSD